MNEIEPVHSTERITAQDIQCELERCFNKSPSRRRLKVIPTEAQLQPLCVWINYYKSEQPWTSQEAEEFRKTEKKDDARVRKLRDAADILEDFSGRFRSYRIKSMANLPFLAEIAVEQRAMLERLGPGQPDFDSAIHLLRVLAGHPELKNFIRADMPMRKSKPGHKAAADWRVPIANKVCTLALRALHEAGHTQKGAGRRDGPLMRFIIWSMGQVMPDEPVDEDAICSALERRRAARANVIRKKA